MTDDLTDAPAALGSAPEWTDQALLEDENRMLSLELFVALYLMVATFAVLMTYYEQVRTQNHDLLFNMLGFAACLVWPVTLVAVTVAAQAQLLLHRA